MATFFLESGTDATQDTKFYTVSTSGVAAAASATDQAHTGSRSLKLTVTTGGATTTVEAAAWNNGLVAGISGDTGRRISFWFRYDTTPTTDVTFLRLRTSGGTTVYTAQLSTAGKLNQLPQGATAANGTTVLAANTWNEATLSYYITNTTTFAFKLYINNILETTANAGTLSSTATSQLSFGMSSAGWSSGSPAFWFDDVIVDNGASSSSQPDFAGAVRVTHKRPNANGTTNGFTTQIGSGGSGYGSGHSPQVNEQPLSVTNGWSTTAVLTAVTEEYNVEGASVGDVNTTGSTIVDWGGWGYIKAVLSETPSLIVNGNNTAFTLTANTNRLIHAYAGSTSFPPGSGADVGIVSDATVTTTMSLFEAGVHVAYIPAATSVGSTATALPMMGVQ